MDKRGELEMFTGAVFTAVGIFATFILPALMGGGVFILAYGALIAGPIAFVTGFNKRYPNFGRPKGEVQTELENAVLVRAMIYTAMADTGLTRRRADRIRDLAQDGLADRDGASAAVTIDAIAEYSQKDYDTRLLLQRSAGQLSQPWRDRVVAACRAVAADDGGPPMNERLAEVERYLAPVARAA